MHKLKKLLPVVISLALPLFSINCASKVVLHPITGTDVYDGKNKGDLCFSPYYISNVMQIKIEK